MNLIATVDKNWAIGKQGHLLVNIPEDIKLFRMETAGKAAIMGRKTYEQITDRTALIDRYNVVLTSDLSLVENLYLNSFFHIAMWHT